MGLSGKVNKNLNLDSACRWRAICDMHKKILCKISVSNYLSNTKYGSHLCGRHGKLQLLCQKSF